ncbi:hypothetical protein [Oceanicaulis sp.]
MSAFCYEQHSLPGQSKNVAAYAAPDLMREIMASAVAFGYYFADAA